jgi:hypothetical protein
MEPPMNADGRRCSSEPKVPIGVGRRVSAAGVRTATPAGFLLLLAAALAVASPRQRLVGITVVNGEGRTALAGIRVAVGSPDTVLVTDESGDCVLAGILPDTVWASVAPVGFLPDSERTIFPVGDTGSIVLDPYADLPRVIDGTVKDARSQSGLAGVEVVLMRGTGWQASGLLSRDPSLTVVAACTTDAAGRYVLNVPPGTNTLDFTLPGYYYRSKKVAVWGSGQPRYDFTFLYDTTFGRVRGTVAADDTSSVVSDFAVTVEEAPQAEVVKGGSEYVIHGLAPGTYKVGVTSLGYEPQGLKATIRAGATTKLDFGLKSLSDGGE